MQNLNAFNNPAHNSVANFPQSIASCPQPFTSPWTSQSNTEPMYKTIANWLRTEILRGRFAAGDKLPSVRTLVTDFSVSHPTVLRALEELAALGYVKLVKGSGTFVAHRNPLSVIHQSTAKRAEENFSDSSLPIAQWQRCVRSAVSDIKIKSSPGGLQALRRAIAAFSRRSRGVIADENQVLVLPGLSTAISLVAELCLSDSATVAVEDPGSLKIRRLLASQGAVLKPIALDAQGMSIEQLKASSHKIDLLHVTPNQNPTGLIMSELRRQSLLNWASHVGTFVLEDDFGGHMMLAANAQPPMFGRNSNNQAIYLGGFWSSLYPLVQTTYLLLPSSLVELAMNSATLRDAEQNVLEQQALFQMLEDGHLELHIKRSKKITMEKRALAISALKQTLGAYVQVNTPNINGKQLVKFDSEVETRNIITAALRSGLPMVSGKSCYLEIEHSNEFILSFDKMSSEKIFDTVLHFAGLLK
jgi:GntR family transcriptional regulator/MocR family aminotransferase